MSYKPIDEVKVRVEEILVNAESCYEEEAPSISVLAQEIRDAISTAIAECGADEVAMKSVKLKIKLKMKGKVLWMKQK